MVSVQAALLLQLKLLIISGAMPLRVRSIRPLNCIHMRATRISILHVVLFLHHAQELIHGLSGVCLDEPGFLNRCFSPG